MASLYRLLSAQPVPTLVLRLTLVLVLLYGSSSAFVEMPLRVLCVAPLMLPALLGNRVLWWSIVATLTVGNIIQWYQIDNHKYLINYWVLACALFAGDGPTQQRLASSARALVAVTFGAAVLWKLLAGEYLSGDFVVFTGLTDPRLERIAAFLSGTSLEDFRARREELRIVSHLGIPGHAIQLGESVVLRQMSRAISVAAIVLELSVAVLHAISARWLLGPRLAALGLFIGTTYLMLPVSGFAFILTVLGLAQCTVESRRWLVAYCLLYIVVQFTLIPWQHLLMLPF